ncbi:8-oxo-dGTP pyrophosphatase MutT (NUDIX family) [Sphingomonas jejuensis]|uniref:8-oxo-dGTP pyrophosphatase MutT (NUDIX family) n=2 Tax=Sphingomonas jejuensis TaxID=904715 RepID=A0ABX0XLU7_9SPHN|nr:8-oxo-dGTP pyrophosphatase MutT (NUDIX family) [Sphingomonas jejuensis]
MAHPGSPPLYPSDDVDGRIVPARPVPAAVLVAITDRPAPGMILTERAGTLRQHSGQVAFPGGRIDPDDASPTAAALREAEEEIGLPPSAVRVVGEADPYLTVTGYSVTPVIGVIPPDVPLVPSEAEVAAVFEVPLSFLLAPGNMVERSILLDGRQRRYREAIWDNRRIWGATAAMIANLSDRLRWIA